MNTSEFPDHFQTAMLPLLAQAMSQMANPVMITDEASRIVWVNDSFCGLTGYTRNELLGRTPSILKSGEHGDAFYVQFRETLLAGRVWHGNMVDTRKDGTRYTAEETITPLCDDDGTIRHFVAVQQDVTERERSHDRTQFLAKHDALTHLYNRAALDERARRAIAMASRSQQLIAIISIGLDGLKEVNDQRGHAVGDQLLAAVADRFRSCNRQSDTLARVGGDAFIALIDRIVTLEAAERMASKVLDALATPVVLRGERFQVSASIGVAIYPTDGNDVNTLIEHADQAMYRAKMGGGCRVQFFDQRQADPVTAAPPTSSPPLH